MLCLTVMDRPEDVDEDLVDAALRHLEQAAEDAGPVLDRALRDVTLAVHGALRERSSGKIAALDLQDEYMAWRAGRGLEPTVMQAIRLARMEHDACRLGLAFAPWMLDGAS